MASTTTEEIRQIRQLTNEIRSESYRYSTTQTQTTEGRIEVEVRLGIMEGLARC